MMPSSRRERPQADVHLRRAQPAADGGEQFCPHRVRDDDLGRQIRETKKIRLDGSGHDHGFQFPMHVHYEYDLAANRTKLIVDDPAQSDYDMEVEYQRDALHRTDSITAAFFDDLANFEDVADYAYFGHRLQTKALGPNQQMALERTYDSKARIAMETWTESGVDQTLVGFKYDYDKVDNPLWTTVQHDDGRYDNYGYNDRYELTGVEYRQGSSQDYRQSAPTDHTFDYDTNFNRADRSRSIGEFGVDAQDPFQLWPRQQADYTVDDDNSYTNISNFGAPQHDKNGNLTQGPVCRAADRRVWPGAGTVRVDDAQSGVHCVEVDGKKEHYRYAPLGRRVLTIEGWVYTDELLLQGSGEFLPVDVTDASTHHAYGWSTMQDRRVVGEETYLILRVHVT